MDRPFRFLSFSTVVEHLQSPAVGFKPTATGLESENSKHSRLGMLGSTSLHYGKQLGVHVDTCSQGRDCSFRHSSWLQLELIEFDRFCDPLLTARHDSEPLLAPMRWATYFCRSFFWAIRGSVRRTKVGCEGNM